jgi:hypothetical protein
VIGQRKNSPRKSWIMQFLLFYWSREQIRLVEIGLKSVKLGIHATYFILFYLIKSQNIIHLLLFSNETQQNLIYMR